MTYSRAFSRFNAALLSLGVLAIAAHAHAETCTYDVTSTEDSTDPSSLRGAIIAANKATACSDIVIQLSSGTHALTIPGKGEDAALTGDLDVFTVVPTRIVGAGADKTVIDGSQLDAVFHMLSQSKLTVADLTVRGGAGAGESGGAFTMSGGELMLQRCHITANLALRGGGVNANSGSGQSLWVEDTTFSANVATAPDGGSVIDAVGIVVLLQNSTLVNNGGTPNSGSLRQTYGTLKVYNSTIANNPAGGVVLPMDQTTAHVVSTILVGNGPGNLVGTGFVTCDHNLIGDAGGVGTCLSESTNIIGSPEEPVNPMLGPLGNNGGPTPTLGYSPQSVIVGNGSNPAMLSNDQRGPGFPRGVYTDIGALELHFESSGCGDGKLGPGEVCDGAALNGHSCEELGLGQGTLACRSDCTGFDTSECTQSPGECPAKGECQIGARDENGQCVSRSRPDGSLCSNGGECMAGQCIAGVPAPGSEPTPGAGGGPGGGAGGNLGAGGAANPPNGLAGAGGAAASDSGATLSCAAVGVRPSGTSATALLFGALGWLVARRRRARRTLSSAAR